MDLQPTDFLSGLGGLANLPHPFEDQQEVASAQATQQQNKNILATQALGLQAAQAKQQQAQQYQIDVANALKTHDFAGLYAKYPDQQKELQAAHDALDEPTKRATERDLFAVSSYIKNGATDSAKSLLQKRIDADKAAGQDASDDQQMLDALNNGDPAHVKAAADMALYAILPEDKRAEVFAKSGEKNHVINPGGALVDDLGNELYRAVDKPERPVEVPIYDNDGHRIGTQLVPVGGQTRGGGPASSGGAPVAGRTTGGWTPRARNGGDNPDDAVDNKIVGVAKALGLDPDADISTIPPVKIAQALAFGEGGAGSVADRNNNPTNIRNGDGSYRKYPNTNAAIQAAAALVAKKISSGQTSVRTLIEGLPAGGLDGGKPGYFGPQGGSAAASAVRPNDITSVPPNMRAAVQAITDGRAAPPRPGTRNGEALLDVVTAYDPTFDASNAASRVKTRVDFTTGKSAQAITAMNTAMGHLLHLDDQAHDLGNFSVLPGLLNPIYNASREKLGNNTALGAFEQTKQAASSELRKVFAGAGGGNLEELKQFESNLSSSKSPEQLHTVIQNAVTLLASRLSSLQDQYVQGMNRSDKIPTFIKPSIVRQANARFGVDLGNPSNPDGKANVAPAAAGPVQVKTRAEALALPPGTPFIDAHGVHRVRP